MVECKTDRPLENAAKHHRAAFFRQSGWLMIANISGGLLMWVVHFLSKAIPKAEYSVFGVCLAAAMVIPTLPLQMVMAQQGAKAIATGREKELSGMIRLVVFGTLGLWALAAIPVLVFHRGILERLQFTNPAALWITLPVLLFALWLPIFWGLLQGQQNFFWLGWSMMLNGIGRLAIAAAAVLVLQSYSPGMMTGVLTGMAIAMGIAAWQTRGLWGIKPQPFDWQGLLGQVVPLMIGFAMFQFLFTADTIFTKAYFDGDTMAAYVGAGTMARALIWLVGPLATVMFPRIVHSAARSEKTNLMTLVLVGTAVLALGGAGFLWLFGPWFIRFVYKASYVEVANSVLAWYALAMIPLALANVLLNNLLARGAFKVVPALCVLAVGYGFALTRFHATLINVIQIMAWSNLLLLLVCAWYTWGSKPATADKAMPG